MSRNPRVTVFIPAYNREQYICTAINSMLAQEYTDFEILVVDDGSTDRTAELVSGYADARVRLESHPRNLGIPASRNRGLELARGEYIALLDSDDYSYPDRLGRQVRFLDRNPDIVQVGSGCTLMDESGRLLPRVRRHPLDPVDIDAHLLFHCALINRTIMGRTAILRDHGYDEAFPRCQDYDLHVRVARTYPMANMPHLLVCGREHDGRITKNTPGLGRDRKMAIQAKVLDQLDLDYSQQDLAWHYQLSQKRGDDIASAAEYLDWADAWLNQLAASNRRVQRFDSAAFSRVLGAMWAVVCWHFCGERNARLVPRLLGSPLSVGIPRNLRLRFLAGLATQRPRTPRLDRSVPSSAQTSG